MVLESLFNPFTPAKKSWHLLVLGFFYGSIALFLSLWIFEEYASLVLVFLSVMAALPMFYGILKAEEEKDLIISPADGIINAIETSAVAPEELGFSKNIKWNKISIFLNVFDVHVNRSPIAGKIIKLNYQKGQFLSANLLEASLKNERQSAVVKTTHGQEVIFVQIG